MVSLAGSPPGAPASNSPCDPLLSGTLPDTCWPAASPAPPLPSPSSRTFRRAPRPASSPCSELLDEGLLITGDEVVLDANSAACRLLGRDYRDVAGRPLADLFPDGQTFLAARACLLIEGERRGRPDFALPDGGVRARVQLARRGCAPASTPSS